MRFVWPVFFLALLLLSSCSSLESALQTGVLGGKSAIRDRNAIRLETVNFPGSTILAVAGVPGKHAFVLVRQAPEGLLLTELDVRTGKTDWSRTLRLPFSPSSGSVVADSRERVYLFPSRLSRRERSVVLYDPVRRRLRLLRLPASVRWSFGNLRVARDNEDGIFFPTILHEGSHHPLLVLYRLLPSGRVRGPFPVGLPPENGNFALKFDPRTDLVWTTSSVRQRPTETSVTTYTGTQVLTQTRLNPLPLSFFDGPALAVLNTNGLLMERIPVGSAAGWITSIFPLTDGRTVRLAGATPTCYSEVTLLAGTWEGLVVLSLKDIGLPALSSISGHPGSVLSLAQGAARIFRDLYGKNAVEKALLSPAKLRAFLARPENRSKKALLLRGLTKLASHPPAVAFGTVKSAGVHSTCELQNPIFSSPLQIADQDWWTITPTGTVPSLTHVFFPNPSLISLMQGPSVQSAYSLSMLSGTNPVLFQNSLGDVLVSGNQEVVLIRRSDVDAKAS